MITTQSECAKQPSHASIPGDHVNLRKFVRETWRLRARLAAIAAEMTLVAVAYVIAIRVLEPFEATGWPRQVIYGLGYLLVLRFAAFLYFGTFKSMQRHAGIADAIRIGEAVVASSVAFGLFSLVWMRGAEIPAVFFVLDGAVLLFWLFLMHFAFRVVQAQRALGRTKGKRVVIVGAGDAGATVTRELALDGRSAFRPVAILDDDPVKQGANICGIPVAGGLGDLTRVVREKDADEILVCIPSASRAQTRRVLMSCLECQVPVRMLPSVNQLVDGRVSQKDLRRIEVEDVLPRDPVENDPAMVQSVVGGKVVLVTGAGGTIGSELCRQIAAANPRMLLLLDKSENGLFYTHLDLLERFPQVPMKPLLVDIVRNEAVRALFTEEKPEIVFHAAAHKHVGLLEIHPKEAIRNNVLGTRNLLLAAADGGVQSFVNISTDKAVNPRCFMGLSKKLTEMMTREVACGRSMRFMSVRFGNVAGSNGSVLRIFWDHVETGKPLRVTDPCATRYFMRISEAVGLIFRAAALGKGGETFILEMGEPVNIYELARTVSLFSGLVPEEELPIEFIGLRQGEKLHEELWEEWEEPRATEVGQILIISKTRAANYSVVEEADSLEAMLDRASFASLERRLCEMVPSFAKNREQRRPTPARQAAPAQPWQPKEPRVTEVPLGERSVFALDSQGAEPA
ncbi:MAG TPA: nucleoside-diphosphate sugar epimerase/dehydratase [Candidatus Acidoferrales bacterium]|nr:nucleoside-diphosphate sugar epimerase/dehydratase [Candidatus Acidoferrales bacterium]